MAEQAHHFRVYANVKDVYAIDRYERECRQIILRCSKVTFRRTLAWLDRNSIADIAVLPWVYRHARHGIDLAEYPSVLNWYTELMARPAVTTGLSVGQALILRRSNLAALALSEVFF